MHTKNFSYLGTQIIITVPKLSLFSLFEDELRRIEEKFSRFLDTSTLSTLNARLGEWQNIDEELYYLFSQAQKFHSQTSGFFDISLKSHLEKSGYDSKYSFKPSKLLFLSTLFSKTGAAYELQKKSVFLRRQVEFGGFGKGYAADRIATICQNHNVSKYYINMGGDIVCKGKWTILLEHPDETENAFGKITLTDGAIASSAPNRRKWSKKHHHLINPHTRQSEQSIKSIFILAKTGIEADAYATALFASGIDEALELSSKLPIETLIITPDNAIHATDGFVYESV